MRIVLHGQQAFGRSVLDALLAQGENVVAVYCAPDRQTGPPDPLKSAALEAELPVQQPRSWRTPDVLQEFRDLGADLCMMAYVTLFVPEEVLHTPTYGTFQYHPSLLPQYRGPSSINWPIIEGQTETGLSIFWPDNGLDTGPILLQKKVAIDPHDTVGSLYFEKLYPLGVAAMLEALELVKQGQALRQPQNEQEASYQSWCRKEHAQINWNEPAQQVYNLIRGCNPQPGAWCQYQAQQLQVYDCRPGDGSGSSGTALPGTVLAIDDAGIRVATQDDALQLQRVRAAEQTKTSAAEWAQQVGLQVGQTLS